jgi:uncharacterized iron-regulated membrane protein
MAEEDSATKPVFKKRTKATFKRKHQSSEDETEPAPQLSVAEILRQRRQGKIRRSAIAAPQQQDGPTSVATASQPESDVDRMKNSFVPQTGQVTGTYDKQM